MAAIHGLIHHEVRLPSAPATVSPLPRTGSFMPSREHVAHAEAAPCQIPFVHQFIGTADAVATVGILLIKGIALVALLLLTGLVPCITM